MVLSTGINRMMEMLIMILILIQIHPDIVAADIWSAPEGKDINYEEYKYRMIKVPLIINKSTHVPFLNFIPVSLFPKIAGH